MRIVTSYANPDLDGVACAVIYSACLAPKSSSPLFAGISNAETAGVLEWLQLDNAVIWVDPTPSRWDDVVLVDCHHPAQLPHVENLSDVSLVIDHHPDGQPDAFPAAEIQNEVVGAAATLVAERVAHSGRGGDPLSPAHAALLACAIASNTLDFSAPSTTERDQDAFKSLAGQVPRSTDLNGLLGAMREWRRSFLFAFTRDAVRQDVKIIDGPLGRVAVAQLESDGANHLLSRLDLVSEVELLAAQSDVDGSLLSLVDTTAGTTTLVCTDVRVREALRTLDATAIDAATMRLPFIALRKTHIIPALLGLV